MVHRLRISARFCAVVTLLCLGCGVEVKPVLEVSVNSSGLQVTSAEPNTAATDWAGWRGPLGNGISSEATAPTTWSATENVVWKAMVPGRGHSSPIVVADRVLLATADESKRQQAVLAFRRSTGEQLWRTDVSKGGFPSPSQMHRKGTHANGTLACDGKQVYAAFLANDQITAYALDLEGNEVWKRTVCSFNSKFGYAPSPLIYKSTIILAADNRGGGCLAALDRKSGEIVWRKQRPAIATYSSPIVANIGGRDQLLISGCNQLASYDPNNGESLWTCDGVSEATCGTVVWSDKHIFASGGYPETETICVDAKGMRVWSKPIRAYEPSMIVFEDHLYIVTDNGIAQCLEAATGKQKWRKRLGGGFSASPLICNGNLYLCNARGATFVIKASPDGFEQVAENQLGNDAFASPAISGGQIFLRIGAEAAGGRQETLYCIGEGDAATATNAADN